MAELSNDEMGGFFTHKYSSKGSIIPYNDDNIGLCWVTELETPFAITCSPLLGEAAPMLDEIENKHLRSKLKIEQIKYLMLMVPYYVLKIHDGRFIATNTLFSDCINDFV